MIVIFFGGPIKASLLNPHNSQNRSVYRHRPSSTKGYLIMVASNGTCLTDVDGDMEEDMDLTEDDFRNVCGQFSGENGTVDVSSKSGVKRPRTTSEEQQPSVHVTYKHLTRASRQKLDSLLQQWSEWDAEQDSLIQDNEQVVESGDETYFPALRVGLSKTSSVSFWFDNKTGGNSLRESVPVESSNTPLYNRGFTIGASNLEIIDDDPPRCFNCGAYSHSMRECPKPFDRGAVSIARRQHKSKRNQTPGSCLPSRYYQCGKYDGLKPGSLDAETRQLLGLGELDPPPWLNRMREIGYPPGYLAAEKDDHLSGITIFGEEGEISGKGSPSEAERRIMTVGFPGINAPIPENANVYQWEQRKVIIGHGYYNDYRAVEQLSSSYPPSYVSTVNMVMGLVQDQGALLPWIDRLSRRR